MRQLALLGWGILTPSRASLWTRHAQEVVVHVGGAMTDPSRAGVPGAEVTGISTHTRVSATVTTKDINAKQIEDLTLRGRNWTQLQLLNGADAVDYRASQEKQERRLALLVALLTFGGFPAHRTDHRPVRSVQRRAFGYSQGRICSKTLASRRSEFVSMAAQYPTRLAEPRPKEAVVTIRQRQATSVTLNRT
jgi:hypothetical protein